MKIIILDIDGTVIKNYFNKATDSTDPAFLQLLSEATPYSWFRNLMETDDGKTIYFFITGRNGKDSRIKRITNKWLKENTKPINNKYKITYIGYESDRQYVQDKLFHISLTINQFIIFPMLNAYNPNSIIYTFQIYDDDTRVLKDVRKKLVHKNYIELYDNIKLYQVDRGKVKRFR